MTAPLKTALRAFFARKARSSAIRAGSSAPSQKLPGADVVQLNTDRDTISDEAVSWLLKCIFREQDLFEYAKMELGARLSTCETCDEINRLKGEQGKPKIKANKPARDQSSEKERRESKPHHKADKQSEIKIDRVEV